MNECIQPDGAFDNVHHHSASTHIQLAAMLGLAVLLPCLYHDICCGMYHVVCASTSSLKVAHPCSLSSFSLLGIDAKTRTHSQKYICEH
jgi:hypothetical protein